MSKTRTLHRCLECGAVSARWAGRCATCQAWNSIVEEVEPVGRSAGLAHPAPSTVVGLGAVQADRALPVPTGVGELDRVLGGGFVPGSISLLGGEPGIGKSTLLLHVAASWAATGRTVLYVCAEESTAQVGRRAARLGAVHDSVLLTSETSLPSVLAAVDQIGPELLVVDSIQTVIDPEVGPAPGTVAQVRDGAARLTRLAKERGIAVVLVGHVTKEGSLAGPRVLEHVVDTVLSFEGDRHHALRFVRAVKHRFGATGELGVFEMTERGLVGVPDASGLFLADRCAGVPGSVVVPAVEGQRPILVEVQALVAQSPLAMPRRSVQGLDQGRVSLLLAVLEHRCGLTLAKQDGFVSLVGGLHLDDPGTDLAVAVAVASAAWNRSVPRDLVVCGEVGLAGELRQVSQVGRRLSEAARLGFRRAVVPRNVPAVDGIELLPASDLRQALSLAVARNA